jgi:hypothetical protein
MGIFSSSKKYRTTRKRLKGALEKISGEQQQTFQSQIQALQDALSSVGQRGEQQLGELGKVYGAQKRDVRERGEQTFARGSQDLSRRGLGNTTITGGLHRGVGEDVNRHMGRLTGMEAGQRANVFGRLGQQESGLYGMLANIYGQQAGAQTALGLQGLPAATMTQQGSPWGQMLGQVGGGLLGSMAGPLGASLGSQLGGSLFGGGGSGPMGSPPPPGMNLNTFA